jgi:hypothetical protein
MVNEIEGGIGKRNPASEIVSDNPWCRHEIDIDKGRMNVLPAT